MMRRTSLIALAAMLSLSAGCAHRRTAAELPPQPPSATETAEGQVQDNGIAPEGVPGSRRDFLQSVPSDRIFFDTDSYSLDAQSRATLDAQAAWLTRNAAVRVTIEGHADERGTREYNLALGDRRANSARDYLQSRGISAARMQTISWGKERPAVDGHDETAWSQNRRAVTVVPE